MVEEQPLPRRQTTARVSLTFIGHHDPEALKNSLKGRLTDWVQQNYGGAHFEGIVIADTFELVR